MKWMVLALIVSVANALPGTSDPLDLAWLSFDRGKYENCLKLGRVARDLYPASAAPHIVLGRCEERLGRFATAHSHFVDAIEVEPGNADALNNRVLMSIKSVQLDVAKRELREFTEKHPTDKRVATLRWMIRQIQDHLKTSKISISETRRIIRKLYLHQHKTNQD